MGGGMRTRLIVYTRAGHAQDLRRREFFCGDMRDARNAIHADSPRKCIFLLTFFAKNLIYEPHCDFRIAKFDVREKQIDEERNEESRPEEKGCSEEKEV